MDKNKIDKFEGEFRWLSNFWHCDVTWEGATYKSSEAAYQAAKTLDPVERYKFEPVTAGLSKKMGRKVNLRPDWEEVKDSIIEDILRCKFDQNPGLKNNLLATGNKELIEGNWWGDVYWGVCKGKGENKLGKLLMKLREEYKGT